MKSLFAFRLFGSAPEELDALPSAPTDPAAQVFPVLVPPISVSSTIHPVAAAALARLRESREAADEGEEAEGGYRAVFKTIGWVTAGLGAVAVGLAVGREIRQRYKFKRRTPYDLYAHAGDERDLEFGVGI